MLTGNITGTAPWLFNPVSFWGGPKGAPAVFGGRRIAGNFSTPPRGPPLVLGVTFTPPEIRIIGLTPKRAAAYPRALQVGGGNSIPPIPVISKSVFRISRSA